MARALARLSVVMPASSGTFTAPEGGEDLWSLFLRGRALNTRSNYEHDLRCFARFAGTATVPQAIDKLLSCTGPQANATIVRYLAYLRAAKFYAKGDDPKRSKPVQVGYAPATVNRRINALRSVVDLARLCGMISWSLQVKLSRAEPNRDTRGCGPAGYAKLLATLVAEVAAAREAADVPRQRISLRDLVIVRLLHDSALRRAEVASILWPSGVRLQDAPSVRVRRKGKTKPVWVPISEPCARAMRRYAKIRGNTRGALLLSTHPAHAGLGVDVATINRRVTHWGRRAGVVVTPHGLRHTVLTSALDLLDGDRRRVKAFSGHEDEASLSSYDDARRDERRWLSNVVASPKNTPEHDRPIVPRRMR